RCLSQGLDEIETRMKAVPWAQGEPIPEIEMRPGLVQVPLRTPTLPPATHTNCYVVGGDEVVVIDPASPYEEEQALLDSILDKRNIREIWLTHLHRDHVSGANHLKKRRGVKIAAHPLTARDLEGVVDVDRTFQQNERLELEGSVYGCGARHVCIGREVCRCAPGEAAGRGEDLKRGVLARPTLSHGRASRGKTQHWGAFSRLTGRSRAAHRCLGHG